jgi:peptidoglycan hydrolase-like protein with peptidoglycan-binding domain
MKLRWDGTALIAAAVVTLGLCTAAFATGVAPSRDVAPTSVRTPSLLVAQVSTGRMEVLRGYDMPFHDYRSSLDDPRLAHGRLDDCMRACLGDDSCMAFTFNSKAKACFLKDGAPTPVAYPGAISGRKSAAAGTAEPMSLDDVRALQSGLGRLGLLAGVPDGIAGPATYRAIARFRAAHGDSGDAIDHSLLDAVTRAAFGGEAADRPVAASGLAEGDAAPSAEAVSPDDGVSTAAATPGAGLPSASSSDGAAVAPLPPTSDYRSIDDVGDTLALLGLAQEPARLNDRFVGPSWFMYENPDRNIGGTELGHRYNNANAVEKEAILNAWKAQKIAAARAFAAAGGNLPLHVFVDRTVQLGAYQPGIGLRIDDGFSSKVLTKEIGLLRARFNGSLLDLPELSGVPVASRAEASALLDQAANRDGRQLVMRLYLTISDVGVDRNLDAPSPGGPGSIAMTLHLDRVTLEKVPALASRRTDDHAPPLAVLYDASSATAAASAPAPGNSLQDVARTLGIPVRNGRLLLAADQSGDDVTEAFGHKWDYRQPRPLNRLLDLMSLRLQPREIDFGRLRVIAAELMDQGQRIRVFGGGGEPFVRDEFARRKALEAFKSQVLPELTAVAPDLPIRITTVVAATLGEYDFERHGFPVRYDSRNRPFPTPSSFSSDQGRPWRNDQDFYALPDFLPMDEQAAEALLHEQRDERGRVVTAVYLAASGTLDRAGPDSQSLVFRVDTLSLFDDAALRHAVLDIDPGTHVLTADEIKAAEAAKHAPVLTGDGPKLAQMQPTAGAGLFAAIGARLSPEARRQLAQENDIVRKADEFHRADATATALAMLEASPPDGLWFSGTIELGAYDSATRTFPVAALHFDPFDPGDTGFAADFASTIADQRFLRRIRVDTATAQTIVEHHDRQVRVRARVEVASAALDENGHLNVVFDIGRLVAWIGAADARDGTIVADIDRARVEAGWHIDPDTVAGPSVLDADSLDYLWLAAAPEPPGDDQLMRMMLARWMIDSHDKDAPANERFFEFREPMPGAILRTRLLPLFRSWAMTRAAHRPSRMVLTLFDNDLDCGIDLKRFRQDAEAFAPFAAAVPAAVKARTYAEEVASYSTPFVGGPYYFVHIGHPLQQRYCQFRDEDNVLAKALGGTPGAPSPALIEVDSLYSYPDADISDRGPSTIEVGIEGIDLLPGDAGQPPRMLVRTRFVAAQFAGPSGPLPVLTREALEQHLAEQNKVANGPDWDILGLRLDMSPAEIDTAIRAHMQVGQVWARDPAPKDGENSVFTRQRLYVSEDGAETLVLALSPAGDRVLAIARDLRQSQVPMEPFMASLRQKYGTESNTFVVSSLNYGMLWQSLNQPDHPGDRPNAPCEVLYLSREPATLRAVEPAGASPSADVPLHPLLPLDPATVKQAAQECGTTVSAGFYDGGRASVTTILADFAAAERLTASEAAAPAAPATTTKPPPLGFDL